MAHTFNSLKAVSQESSSTHRSSMNNILIWAAGGPAAGKTTMLCNLFSIMEKNFGTKPNNMFIIGNKLIDSLQITPKPLREVVQHNWPIIIDDHCINPCNIESILNFASKYSYQTVLIHPWISHSTFMKRIEERKTEIGRIYDPVAYWQIHQNFSVRLHDYITKICPFTYCLVYDNNHDIRKDILFCKTPRESYVVDDHWLTELKNNISSSNKVVYPLNPTKQSTCSFIPKKQYMTPQLETILEALLWDISGVKPRCLDSLVNELFLNPI